MYMFIVVKYVYVHMHQFNITCIYIYTSSLILYIHPVTTAQPPIRCDPSRFAPAKITLMTKGYPFFTKISSSHQTKRKKKLLQFEASNHQKSKPPFRGNQEPPKFRIPRD